MQLNTKKILLMCTLSPYTDTSCRTSHITLFLFNACNDGYYSTTLPATDLGPCCNWTGAQDMASECITYWNEFVVPDRTGPTTL